MLDHFRAECRWDRDEPRLAVVAVPARSLPPLMPVTFHGQPPPEQVAGELVHHLADELADVFGGASKPVPVQVVPAKWLHVPIALLGHASEMSAPRRRALLAELDLVARSGLGACRAGWVEVGCPILDRDAVVADVVDEPCSAPVLAPVTDLVRWAATRAGVRDVSTPPRVRMTLAYGRASETDDWWRDAPVQGRILRLAPVRWYLDRVVLVEMVQDHEAGYYTWTPPFGQGPVWMDNENAWPLPKRPRDDQDEPDWVRHPEDDPHRHLRGMTPQQYRQQQRQLDALRDLDSPADPTGNE